MTVLKPIIKYAGGKRSIMEQIMKYFPDDFENYFEPFFGGGSVLFHLENKKRLGKDKSVYISDISEPLMNMYHVIKEYPSELITELKKSDIYKNNKTTFNENRTEFNRLKAMDISTFDKDTKVKLAGLYIYLNRVCFNGMYRENKKGEYNVPFGKQKNPIICNEVLINEISTFLNGKGVEIRASDYSYIKSSAKKGDFIYFDPPYYNTFTGYNKIQFDKDSQIKLMESFKYLTEIGCKVALSNSNSDFIRELYSNNEILGVRIIEIDVKRVINSKSEERKKEIKELLIVNF